MLVGGFQNQDSTSGIFWLHRRFIGYKAPGNLADMATALGVKFKDEQDQEFIPTGGTLSQIYKIDMNNIYSKIKDIEFISMCDVDNPLCGRLGASAVFAPQKGADEDMVKSLDRKSVV